MIALLPARLHPPLLVDRRSLGLLGVRRQKSIQSRWSRNLPRQRADKRDAAIFLHMNATAGISRFKAVKAMFPHSAGIYVGPEQ